MDLCAEAWANVVTNDENSSDYCTDGIKDNKHWTQVMSATYTSTHVASLNCVYTCARALATWYSRFTARTRLSKIVIIIMSLAAFRLPGMSVFALHSAHVSEKSRREKEKEKENGGVWPKQTVACDFHSVSYVIASEQHVNDDGVHYRPPFAFSFTRSELEFLLCVRMCVDGRCNKVK